MFRYTEAQVSRMQRELTKRSAALQQLSPWPDINYMLDESWARIHPYGSEASTGQTLEFQLRILNHAPRQTKYRVKWNVPEGWTVTQSHDSVTIGPRQEGSVIFQAGSVVLAWMFSPPTFSSRTTN